MTQSSRVNDKRHLAIQEAFQKPEFSRRVLEISRSVFNIVRQARVFEPIDSAICLMMDLEEGLQDLEIQAPYPSSPSFCFPGTSPQNSSPTLSLL